MNKTFTIGGDLTVNRIGFGAMRITGPGVFGMPEDKQTSIDVVRRAGGNADSQVEVRSLEPKGSYNKSFVHGSQISHALLATHLNGERLNVDHGYPLRLIAPNRAGVLNTKWLTSVRVI